jgi:hypothetical protein
VSALRRFIADTGNDLAGLPIAVRAGLLSAVVGGWFGGMVGLVVGLAAHPPTAWAAFFELGIPAAVVCGVLGLIGGAVAGRARG